MTKQRNYRGVSRRARNLLRSGEDIDVDYKENVKGLHPEDLVAFANSKKGGAILIGVKEVSDLNGKQKGEPIGHDIDDSTRLKIMSKALSCSPPIQIEIFIENLNHLPFIRIEIPSGSHKPYSTNSGTYKIRADGRNMPLLPEQLLNMFVEREGEEFRKRFSEATRNLESNMTAALELVENLEHVISRKIEEIGDTLGWAEYKAGDAADTIETVQGQVHSLTIEAKNQKDRIKAILHKINAEDPVKLKAERETLEYLVQKLKKDPSLLAAVSEGRALSVSLSGEFAEELDKEDLNRLLTKAVKEVLAEKSDNKGA
jgi:hypothetical protein